MKLTILLFASAFLFSVESCTKSSYNPPTTTPPVILSISPDSGAYNTVVTITGKNFSADTTKDSVKFDGQTAVIESATDSTLVVKVSAGSGTGPVIVVVRGDTATGPVFNYRLTVTVSTLAGNPKVSGWANGTGSAATFGGPEGIAVDAQGNVFVADFLFNLIREITPAGVTTTLAGVPNQNGIVNGTGSSAKFIDPEGLAVDTQDNVYVAENADIRKITSAGVVTTLAGNGTNGYADGAGSTVEFNNPNALALDGTGNVYVADGRNDVVRKITPAGVTSTLAGNGTSGYVDGAGTAAEFFGVSGMGIDNSGNLYTAEYGDPHIRKITLSGTVSTIAGNGQYGFVNGSAGSAEFNTPFDVAVDSKGNVYVSDQSNQCIRMITPSGTVSTLAGNGTAGYQDGPGASAEFGYPYGIAVDLQGNVYVADYYNLCIRKITIQ